MGPYPGLVPPGAPNHIVSIREERYKLAEYHAPDRPNVQDQFEMYDRLNDPLEIQNLAFEGFQRNNEQQMEYVRLQAKLAVVKATRLQPLG